MPYPRCRFRYLVACLCALLGACGGGGGGGGDSPANPAPPAIEEPSPPPPAPEAGFRLSGQVVASSSQMVDGDTNDPNQPVTPNDSLSDAQPLPNPVTLGGYVNLPGEGEDGRSRDSGDKEDFYAIDLLAGQAVTLLVADATVADADLYLYDDAGDIVDFSIETGEIETVTVERSGHYRINVSAFSGATNYLLVVGAPAPTARASAADIVPGEIIVEYEDNPALTVTLEPDLAWQMGMRQAAGGPGRARLLAMEKSFAQQRQLGREAPRLQQFRDPAQQARWETLLSVKLIAARADVRRAEPNYRLRPAREPDDRAYPLQWHYPLINLPAAWSVSTGSPEVIVAVVDTGILAEHPDLAGQLVPGYDFIRDPSRAGDGDGIDPDPEDTGERGDPGASRFHGTHVAGTIAARTDNAIGTAGVAWRSRVMPLRALAGDSGTSYDINQAIRYAAGLSNDSGRVPRRPADIINLSFSGEGFSGINQQLFQDLRRRGILVVAAAGNQGSREPTYPADYEGVLSVAAVDGQRQLTAYSNRGPGIDLAAPGGDSGKDVNGDGYPDGVLSLGASVSSGMVDFGYYFSSGTSMAAPHVAGVLALMKAVNPDLDHDGVIALLQQGKMTDDAGPPGRDDRYGYGILNAGRALQSASDNPGPPVAELATSTRQLNFGNTINQLDLFLSNRGSGTLQVLEVSTDQPWLTVDAADVDTDGLGRYRLVLDRERLPDNGLVEATVIARSTSNSVSVRVLAAGGGNLAADVGTLYLLVYDPETDEAVAQALLRNQNGTYPFLLEDVAPGEYELYAGSDADNDLFICDAGEACGAWLTLDQPATLVLEEDRDDIEFPVDFLVNLPGQAPAGTTGTKWRALSQPVPRMLDTGQEIHEIR